MKYFILSILLLCTFNIEAQNLSFADLKYILQHTTENCDSYLTNKNYFFMASEESNSNKRCPTTTWAFSRNKVNNRANSFVIKFCDEANQGFIFYQFGDKLTYEKIKSSCKSQGFMLTDKTTSPTGNLVFTFLSDKYKVEFESGVEDDSNANFYIISLHTRY